MFNHISLIVIFIFSGIVSPLALSNELPEFGKIDRSAPWAQDEFEYYRISLNSKPFAVLMAEADARILLPSVLTEGGFEAQVMSVDVSSSASGDAVYSGSVIDPKSKQPIGDFVYANFRESSPYLSVKMPNESYEIFEDATTEEFDFLLKLQTEPVFQGKIDLDDEEYDKWLANTPLITRKVEPESESTDQRGVTQSRASCFVDLGVGYTSAALTRNGSIVSAIGTMVSGLNTLVNGIGSTCDYRLVGTLAATYTESTIPTAPFNSSAVTDVLAIPSNTQITNWKDNVVNADIFVLITSAAITAGPLDIIEGVANQNGSPMCNTIYKPMAACGEYSVVRDDYANSIYVFAHEVLHLAGAKHAYAYGGELQNPYGGNGFTSPSNGTEVSVTGSQIRSTTVMTNPPPNSQCSVSSIVIARTDCASRLPYIASQTRARVVHEAPTVFTVRWRYFPDFYPEFRPLNPYSISTPSMEGVIQTGMTINSTQQ